MGADKQRKRAARALAAAEGISYTAALRRLTEHTAGRAGDRASGPGGDRAGWDPAVVDALTGLIRRGEAATADLVADEPPHIGSLWGPPSTEWGIAQATATGYAIRRVNGPTRECLAEAGVELGARVPVPYPAPGGAVEITGLWPLVTLGPEELGWWWIRNGWAWNSPAAPVPSRRPPTWRLRSGPGGCRAASSVRTRTGTCRARRPGRGAPRPPPPRSPMP